MPKNTNMNTKISYFFRSLLMVTLFSGVLSAQTHERKTYLRTNRGVATFTTPSTNGCDGAWFLDQAATGATFTAPSGGELCVELPHVSEYGGNDYSNRIIEEANYLALTVLDTLDVNSAWSYKVELELKRTNTGQSPVTQNYDAWISYDPTARKKHQDRIIFELPGDYDVLELVSFTVLDSAGTGGVTSFHKNWLIELIMQESVYDTTSAPALTPSSAYTSNLDIDLNWTSIPQPGWYQLEWVFIDSSTTVAQSLASYFARSASRVVLDTNHYRLTNHFAQTGDLYTRVRSVRPAWTGSAINENVHVFSPWYSSSLNIAPAQVLIGDSLNWSYTSAYSENGKRVESISYHDGLGMPREQLTKPLEYDSIIIASQTFLDFAGNPALQLQPAPVRGTDLRYQSGLNTFNGAAQNPKLFFDSNGVFPMAMDTLSGSNQYYSGANDLPAGYPLKGLTPRADGHAYSYAEYDASGRIRYQNIPGRTFRLDTDSLAPNHFNRYEYFKARKSDIYPFLGNHASHHEDYTVQDITDANQQRTVTITDNKGRTVITALTTQPENLMPIDSKPEPIYTIEDLLEGTSYNLPLPNSKNPKAYAFEYALPIRNNSDVVLNYSAIGNFLSTCESYDTLCYQCKYEAEVTLLRHTGDTVLHWQRGDLSVDSAGLAAMKVCSPDSLQLFDIANGLDTSYFSVLPPSADTTHAYGGGVIFTLNKGRYIVKKELRLMGNAGLNILADDYIFNATASECLKDEYYFIDSTTTAANYQCPQTYSNYSVEDGPCSDLKKDMMEELYPTQGKYASFFSGIDTTDTFSLFKAILNQPIYGANMLVNGDFENGNTGFVTDFTQCSGSFAATNKTLQLKVSSNPSLCYPKLDNAKNHGTGQALTVMKNTTDYLAPTHNDSLNNAFVNYNPDTVNYFLIYGEPVILEAGQTYNFQGDFWDMTNTDSLNFLPSAIRIFVNSQQIGVVHVNATSVTLPYQANFNFTATTSDTFYLMVMADLTCCGWDPNLNVNTHLNYGMDNLHFSTLDFSCGCEGLNGPEPTYIMDNDFENGTSGWGGYNGGVVSNANGKLRLSLPSASSFPYATINLTNILQPNTEYTITYDLDKYASNTLITRASVDGAIYSMLTYPTSGQVEHTFTTPSSWNVFTYLIILSGAAAQGSYFTIDNFQINDVADNSLFYGANYPYQCLESAFEEAGITEEGVNPALLGVFDFILQFDTSWLETMLPAHPEYCNLKSCEVIYSDSSVAFLQKLNEYSWADAQADWNTFAYDTTGQGQLGLFPHDPLFVTLSNPQHDLHFLYLEMQDRLRDYFWFGTNYLSIDQAMVLFSWPAANMLTDTALLTASGDTNLLNDWLVYANDSTYDPAFIGEALWEKYAAAYEQHRNFLANNYYQVCPECGFDTLISNSLQFQAEQKIEAIKAKSFLLFGDSNLMDNDTLDYQAYYNFVDSMTVINEQGALDQCFDWIIFQLQKEFAMTLDTNDSTWYITGTSISDSALADTLQYYCAGDSSLASIEAVYNAMGIPSNLQQNVYLLEVTQPYEELYSMMALFNAEWEDCFPTTAAGDSIGAVLNASSTLPSGIHWYNPVATGYQIPTWVNAGGLTFSNFTCDSLMIQNSIATMGSYASFHFFMVDVTDGSNSTSLRGFYKSAQVFDDEGTAGPLGLSLPPEDERIYCPQLLTAVDDFFETTMVVNYLNAPLYTPPGGGAADTLALALHPSFAPLVSAYVSQYVGQNHGQFEVIEMIASCAIIDSLVTTIPALAFHFADSVFYDTRSICPSNSEWVCDSCDWFYDKMIAYEYANANPNGSAMRIDSIRQHFGGLGVDTNQWTIEYPYDVNTDNYNHLFAYQKSSYNKGLFHFLDQTLDEWNDADTVVPNGGSLTLYGYFDDDPGVFPNGLFPFGSFSGSYAAIDSISEGINAPSKCWIRHSGNGTVWFHFGLEDADTFHDIFLNYDHYESGFELSDLTALLFIQPLPSQGEVFDFYAGFLDTDSNMQFMMGSASFPVAYMCDIPALSLVQRPTNPANTWQPDCMELKYYDAYEKGEDLYELYIQNKRKQFKQDYLATCRGSLDESLIWGSDLGTYHYTLYFYDRADNLMRTVPPEGVNVPTITLNGGGLLIDTNYNANAMAYLAGMSNSFQDVNHTMETEYAYDSYNQVIEQKTPDGGKSSFNYDVLGRIRFSQNAKQAQYYDFSYMLYDNLSRIIETGQFKAEEHIQVTGSGSNHTITLLYGPSDVWSTALATGLTAAEVSNVFPIGQQNTVSELSFDQVAFIAQNLNATDWQSFITGHLRTHAIVTLYDYQTLYGNSNYGTGTDRNLRNRVSAMYKYEQLSIGGNNGYDNAMIYQYDVAGNVNTLYREAQDMGFKISKKFEYIYDQVSGNVYEMRYQAGKEDALWHRYSYDAQNRLERVETSRNGTIWDRDAEYEYYAHGPLARVIIGHRAIQSVEYAYTLQGWLKAINGLKPLNQNGVSPSGAEDLFAMNLHYHEDDFSPVDANAFSEVGAINKVDLFNGNIAATTKRLVQPQNTVGNAALDYLETGKKYRYDQLNRIKEYWDFDVIDGLTGWEWDNLNGIYADYRYDGNGNILNLNRSGQEKDNAVEEMDDMEYLYKAGTNRLTSVCEMVPAERFCCDYDEVSEVEMVWKPLAFSMPDSTAGTVTMPGTYCNTLATSWPFLTSAQFICEGIDLLGEYQPDDGAYSSDSICGVDTVNAYFSLDGGETAVITIITAMKLGDPEYEYDASGNMVADKESGLEIEWNPIGKVKRVDKYKRTTQKEGEGGDGAWPAQFNPLCPDCPVSTTAANPGGGDPNEPVYVHSYLTKTWDGSTEFDYDPMGERVKKRNRINEEVMAHNNRLANWNDTTIEQAALAGICINHPDRYTYYMRDAQGNLIATYNLALELKERRKFYKGMLRNLEDLWDISPQSTFDSVITPIISGKGDFRRQLLRITSHDLGELLDSVDHNAVFDNDPSILILLNDHYEGIHPIGFWDRYPTQAAELLRTADDYRTHVTIVAEDMADSIYADEISLFNDHEETLEDDVNAAWAQFIECYEKHCSGDETCLECEQDRSDLSQYNDCLSQNNCAPPYCSAQCNSQWVSYNTLASLLNLWERYDLTKDSIYANLLSGSGSYLKKYHFTADDLPLSHTEASMESALVTGNSWFRAYLDVHYGTIGWKSEVLPIVDNNRLLDQFFPAVAKDWFAEAMDTVNETDTLEALATMLADSIGNRYRPEDFLADLDEVYGANTWRLLMVDTTDTAGFNTALAAYKTLHVGSFDAIADMGDFVQVVDNKPVKYLAYTLAPEEYFVYGSSRLGSIYHYPAQETVGTRVENTNIAGKRRYELADHLGNVQVVMSDRLAAADTGGATGFDTYQGDVWSVMDYYPFGMLLSDRSANMEEMTLARAMYKDTVEIVSWTEKVIDEPDVNGAFQQPLNGTNQKWKAKLWSTTTDQTATPDYTASQTTSSPYAFQLNGSQTEMQLAGRPYKSMRIEYAINTTTVPNLAANDSFVVKMTPIFDGSFFNAKVEVRDHTTGNLILSQNLQRPNNVGWQITVKFNMETSTAVDVIIRADFAVTDKYEPNFTHGGMSNWTNAIYLRRWHLTHYRRNVTEEIVSDTSEYFYRNRYMFGFQGQERDDEIRGAGNSYAFNYRFHDPRLGRWLSIDPLSKKFPFYSPYHFAGNTPIVAVDLEGLEDLWIHYRRDESGSLIKTEEHYAISQQTLPTEYRQILNQRLNVQGEVPETGVVETVEENDGKTYVINHVQKIVEIKPKSETGEETITEKIESVLIQVDGKSKGSYDNYGEMEGRKGFESYTKGMNATGSAIQGASIAFGPLAPGVAGLGLGISIFANGLQSADDFSRKPVSTASINTGLRALSLGSGVLLDKFIPNGSTGYPVMDHLTKTLINYEGNEFTNEGIRQVDDAATEEGKND